MSVYVDDMSRRKIGEFASMKMSHLAADTHSELLDMADKIGVASRWIQQEGDSRFEHFDVSMSKRRLAIQHGAIPITYRAMSLWMSSGRQTPPQTEETSEQHTLW